MALDGIVINNIKTELEARLSGARIKKIAQPESDALLITFKAEDRTAPRLYISASASLPLIYFTDENKQSPMTAPNFCMLLRKYISGGRVTGVSQPGLERIIRIDIEHLDELGDPSKKTLVIELMGKHSNIIFLNSDGMILDSIKHVTAQMSSVREVFPGREYFIPAQAGKRSLFDSDKSDITAVISSSPTSVSKAVYGGFTGISPLIANELCHRAGIDADCSCSSLDEAGLSALADEMLALEESLTQRRFFPSIVFEGDKPIEFSSVRLTMFGDLRVEGYDDISSLLRTYYEKKDIYTRIRQKSSDLRKIISTHIQRSSKKYDLQLKQLKDTEKMDKYRVYGELINTYGYQSHEGDKSLSALNYYTGEEITIPLDPTLSPAKNAQKYFERYNKLKRTKEALDTLLSETKAELDHLETTFAFLDMSTTEDDLASIKQELIDCGYIKSHQRQKGSKNISKSKPYHYLSDEGYDIYVGKNNYQNDELTFKVANSNDWWFHAKKIPGSHVIVKGKGCELPDSVFEKAAALAAYYSKASGSGKVEIDYLQRKDVKKPNGAKPGYVIYYTNYSMSIEPALSGVRLID